jgi:hypothetical protein
MVTDLRMPDWTELTLPVSRTDAPESLHHLRRRLLRSRSERTARQVLHKPFHAADLIETVGSEMGGGSDLVGMAVA